MRLPRRGWTALLVAVGVAACGDGDGGQGPVEGTLGLVVASDPAGAAIRVDNQETGLVTPDTIFKLTSGKHQVGVKLDSGGIAYGVSVPVTVPAGEELGQVVLPLLARCANTSCLTPFSAFHDVAGVRFTTNPLAMPFYQAGSGRGLIYPASSGNSYASIGAAVFAGFPSQGGPDPVALGVYPFDASSPTPYWAGRPVPSDSTAGGRLVHRQTTWVLPPDYFLPITTVRGLEIEQRIEGRNDLEGVLVVRLVFRNITDRASYRAVDDVIGPNGLTYDNAYVGFAVDADIGDPDDDLVAYFPAERTVAMYDGDFQEVGFNTEAGRPAFLGVRLLEAPSEATTAVLTTWNRAADWFLGKRNEGTGWVVLSAQGSSRTGTKIGPVTEVPQDYRIAVSAGPLRLAPGDSAMIRLAVVLANPVAGTYTSGTVLLPGDPDDPSRPIARAAATLLQRAAAAQP